MKQVLWDIFEIAINFFQSSALIYFLFKFLGDKKERKFLSTESILYIVVLTTVISVMNYISAFEHIYVLVYMFIMFLYSHLSLKGSILKKIFAVIFPSAIMSVSTTFVGNFASVIFKTDFYSILSEQNIERFISVVTVQIVFLYLIILFLKLLKRNKDENSFAKSELLLILLVLIITMIIGALLNFISFDSISDKSRLYIVAAFACIIILNAIVGYFVVDLGRKNRAVNENKMLRLEQSYNRQYLKNINTEYDVIRKLRHDFKNSFNAVQMLLAEGKNDRAIQYIENNICILSETEILINTNNDLVNAVVNAHLSAAKSYGIQVTCLSVADIEGIDDIDLCRLLSNMLENAVTACKNCNRKHIFFKISSDEYKYTFTLKNTIDHSVLKDNPQLRSTKDEKSEHGLGTKIITDIARKYNGEADFYEESGNFCCNVILKK